MSFVLQQTYSFCIHGTCGFPCRCKNKTLCESEKAVLTCECQKLWWGSGCQNGYINASSFEIIDGRQAFIHFDGIYVIYVVYFYNTSQNVSLSTGDREYRGYIFTEQYRGERRTVRMFNMSSMKTNRLSIIKHPKEIFELNKVVVTGYKYIECRVFDGNYFYGAGCSIHCHCSRQCDYINGTCLGNCTYNSTKSRKNVCRCQRGRWGKNCEHTCNCRKRYERCDEMNGRCRSGCREGYIENEMNICVDQNRSTRMNTSEHIYATEETTPRWHTTGDVQRKLDGMNPYQYDTDLIRNVTNLYQNSTDSQRVNLTENLSTTEDTSLTKDRSMKDTTNTTYVKARNVDVRSTTAHVMFVLYLILSVFSISLLVFIVFYYGYKTYKQV